MANGEGEDKTAGRAAQGRTPEAARAGRARGFAPAGRGIRTALVESAARFGFAEPQLLTHWPEVVGPRLANRCRPVRVRYGRGQDLSRTLVVAADGAAALEIEYEAPAILARVNERYGYGAITRIAIDQSQQRGPTLTPPGARGEPVAEVEPAAGTRRAAEARLGAVGDDALRDALGALGAYILAAPRRDD
ncbi:MAG: DUF721 domain-containing protein [Paracoccaceae bacterium]